MLGKMSRRRRARVDLPLDEQPEMATMSAFLSAMAAALRGCREDELVVRLELSS